MCIPKRVHKEVLDLEPSQPFWSPNMVKSQVRPYTTKTGLKQFKPSLELVEEMIENSQGFCLACGEVADGVEPDARKYECECCGKPKVYGAEELALMGLTF